MNQGTYQQRRDKVFDDYRECCKEFANKICDTKENYHKLNDHERTMLIEEFSNSLDVVISNFELVYCEMGLRFGFKLALNLGL